MPDVDLSLVRQLHKQIWQLAEHGKGPFAGAPALVDRLRSQHPGEVPDALIERLLVLEQRKTVVAAAMTAIVSTIALPAGLPASMFASAVLDARMALAVALCRGANLDDEHVRSTVQDAAQAVPTAVRAAGTSAAAAGASATWQSAMRTVVPGIAVRGKELLLRQAGKRWARRLLPVARGLPVLGSVVIAALDAPSLRAVVMRVEAALEQLQPERHKVPTNDKLR